MSEKKDIIKTILIVWVIATTGYVAMDVWNDYKIKGIQAAYQQGQKETIAQVINQAKNGQCQPFDVSDGEGKTQIVDASCLSQAQQADLPMDVENGAK